MMFIIRTPKYFQLHLLAMVSNGKPGKTTLKYSLKKNELKICPSNLHQQLSQDNKTTKKQKTKNKTKQKNRKKKISNMHKCSTMFCCDILILIPNSHCIHLVNFCCKFVLDILIVNV